MSKDQVAAYYRRVFSWDKLESFATCQGTVPFHETLWKFIYLDNPDRWSKWRWFPTVEALRVYVLESYDGFRNPIATLNYGQQRTRGERFLTFDVDLNDYGSLRNLVCSCGTQKQACADCWSFWMSSNVIPIIKQCLEDMWGFKDILYVFSGRRGLHVHVRDERARRMTAQQRARVLESFRSFPIVDVCWPQLELVFRRKTRQECSEIYEQVLSHLNPLPGQYFGGADNLWECCEYLRQHAPCRQVWEEWKESVCRALCAPKFDEPVTQQVTHACKVPETLHQVTLNVCKTFDGNNFGFQPVNVRQFAI